MKRLVICVISFMTISTLGWAEEAYRLNLYQDVALSGTSLGVAALGYIMEGDVGNQQTETNINRIDRTFMFPGEESLDKAGTVLACGALLMPGISALAAGGGIETWSTYGIMYTQAFLLTSGTKNLLKAGVSRWRPYTYDDSYRAGTAENEGNDDYYNSFPSGHTAYAFLGASFLSTTFRREFPESRWKTPLTAAAYGLAGSVGVLRVLSGEHFFSDVAAGAAIGSLWGAVIPYIHRNQSEESGIQITSIGRSMSFTLKY